MPRLRASAGVNPKRVPAGPGPVRDHLRQNILVSEADVDLRAARKHGIRDAHRLPAELDTAGRGRALEVGPQRRGARLVPVTDPCRELRARRRVPETRSDGEPDESREQHYGRDGDPTLCTRGGEFHASLSSSAGPHAAGAGRRGSICGVAEVGAGQGEARCAAHRRSRTPSVPWARPAQALRRREPHPPPAPPPELRRQAVPRP